MIQKSRALRSSIRTLVVCLFCFANAFLVSAQSSDVNAPSPVRKSDVLGTIGARDLGDARLTNHYYAFSAVPGDLLITIQSKNLNGDIDVFTAGTLRPLLKLSLYAESSTPVTKGIYLRRRESLILRIEARSPNDDEGIYEIRFSGTFEPIVGGPDIGEAETPNETSGTTTARKGKRVSSVGARIDEPVTEVAAAPSPEPTPEATPSESPSPQPSAKKPSVKTSPAESARTRRPAGRKTTPATKPTTTTGEESKPTEETADPEVATTPKPPTPRRTNRSRSGTTARPVKPPPATPAEPEAEVGPRLIVETNDGTLINRSMGTVRRVTVENGWVVVTGNDRKIVRVLLANVVRMTIQP
jgi:hypothetical protein